MYERTALHTSMSMCINASICVWTYVYVYAHAYIHTRVCMSMCAYIHTSISRTTLGPLDLSFEKRSAARARPRKVFWGVACHGAVKARARNSVYNRAFFGGRFRTTQGPSTQTSWYKAPAAMRFASVVKPFWANGRHPYLSTVPARLQICVIHNR